MTLLHMVGEESSAGGTWGVGVTAGKLCKAYRQRLGGDLKVSCDGNCSEFLTYICSLLQTNTS
jgi:hypothetical protein